MEVWEKLTLYIIDESPWHILWAWIRSWRKYNAVSEYNRCCNDLLTTGKSRSTSADPASVCTKDLKI